MATIFDVARYITEKTGEVTAMKLQKLMFYSQAWNLVWEEEPLFADDFQAWANGPVLPNLYSRHRGCFKVSAAMFNDGNLDAVSPAQRENIDKVLGFYGEQNAQWLSNLTHQEAPWKDARARDNCQPGDHSTEVITQSAIHEYYSSL
jgi:uncharacterized phage-associated protein